MNTKHTAGPWAVTAPNHHRSYYVRRVGAKVGELAVCQIMTGRPASERDANARLIAAAPELLAALEHLTVTIEQYHQMGFISGNESHHATVHARAALAKATS